METVGKTLDDFGNIVEVYECEDCHIRTKFKGSCSNCVKEFHEEEAFAGCL